ncbi:putative T7SS-secreted protein [Streptomyces sp. MS06]|uniref:putative T7SS-secreted protein n=1 Tax=Streptomyces sp. MS06 TaxID=3385974 RepID=UPI0039A06A39
MGDLRKLGGHIENGVNDGLGKLEDGFHQGEKLVGKGVDWGAHKVGDELDRIGLHDVADTVDDWGDEVASDLGATPGEQQLGQTDEPDELVHGNPGRIRDSAQHLKSFFTAFAAVGDGMRRVDSSGWRGEGGDSFRKKFGLHPTKWHQAAEACESAAGALEAFADTVVWAQSQAREAIASYDKGKRASEHAVKAYNKRIDAYNAKIKADQDPGPTPEPFQDPGKAEIRAAREKLAAARKQRNSAASHAESLIKAALAHAPAEPPPLDRLRSDLTDGAAAVNTELTHFGGGLIKGTAGLLNFVRTLNPVDPYNLTHPAEYLQGVSTTLSGLVSTAAQPQRTLKSVVDGFRKDPSEFLGRLVPQVVGTDGVGLAEGGLRMAAEEGAEATAATVASKGVSYGGHEAAGAAAEDWSGLAKSTEHVSEKAIHFDSVDPATAQKFLDDQYPWLKDVNNTGAHGYTQNCSHNVDAVNQRLDGVEVSAAPKDKPDHVPPERLGLKDRPKGHYDMVGGYDDIIRDLEARGEGSRSVVYISRSDGSAHVFNAVNTDHGVVFLDGQTGTLGRLEKDVTSVGHIPYRDGVLK